MIPKQSIETEIVSKEDLRFIKLLPQIKGKAYAEIACALRVVNGRVAGIFFKGNGPGNYGQGPEEGYWGFGVEG